MFLMPLKEKYLTVKAPYKCGKYSSRTGNSSGPTPKYRQGQQGNGPRRRQGLGATVVG